MNLVILLWKSSRGHFSYKRSKFCVLSRVILDQEQFGIRKQSHCSSKITSTEKWWIEIFNTLNNRTNSANIAQQPLDTIYTLEFTNKLSIGVRLLHRMQDCFVKNFSQYGPIRRHSICTTWDYDEHRTFEKSTHNQIFLWMKHGTILNCRDQRSKLLEWCRLPLACHPTS